MKIPLTQGKFAIVDKEDYAWLSQWKWHAHKGRGQVIYAERQTKLPNGKQRPLGMHRAIMDAKKGQQIDHINGDTLDNRRSNLRFSTQRQNTWNRKVRKDCISGLKGVRIRRKLNKWQAVIFLDGKDVTLGYYSDPVEAAKVYNQAAQKHFGEFARLNAV